jgi:hypothetical protein
MQTKKYLAMTWYHHGIHSQCHKLGRCAPRLVSRLQELGPASTIPHVMEEVICMLTLLQARSHSRFHGLSPTQVQLYSKAGGQRGIFSLQTAQGNELGRAWMF